MRYNEIVDGKVFRAYQEETIAADGTLIFQFTTPPNKTVIFEKINVVALSQSVRLISYEVDNLTEGSTPMYVINSNFALETPPNTTLTSDPTGINGRKKKSSMLIPAMSSEPSNKTITPFTLSDDNFSILKPGTNYTIELTNNGDAETIVDVQILFREL